MNIPEAVTGLRPLRVDDEYLPYCKELNQIIRRWALSGTASKRPNFAGTIYTYADDDITFVYQDSDFGNDHYMIENSKSLVYHFQDSPDRQVLLYHTPGPWYDSIQKYNLDP